MSEPTLDERIDVLRETVGNAEWDYGSDVEALAIIDELRDLLKLAASETKALTKERYEQAARIAELEKAIGRLGDY